MAVECAIKNDKLFVYGESATTAQIDYDKIAKDILKSIGYENDFIVIKELSSQSPDINQAVVKSELCANDQGIVYGFACNETKELMPMPIMVAHKLMKKYDDFRRGTKTYFADAKSQVSVQYDDDGKPEKIKTIVLSVSHDERLSHEQIENDMKKNVIAPVLEEYGEFANYDIKYIINPSGKFTIWGSFGDSGCTGRKIVVDTYGGVGRVGGGCFSSKNATKVDRSGAYYARYVAKNVVAHGLADKCEIQLSFAIGLPKPVSIHINTFSSNKVSKDEIYDFIKKNFDFRLENMISELKLTEPIFKQTACFGHFGREEFPWEKIKPVS
jgi:S-adenosylmethionine synthetase